MWSSWSYINTWLTQISWVSKKRSLKTNQELCGYKLYKFIAEQLGNQACWDAAAWARWRRRDGKAGRTTQAQTQRLEVRAEKAFITPGRGKKYLNKWMNWHAKLQTFRSAASWRCDLSFYGTFYVKILAERCVHRMLQKRKGETSGSAADNGDAMV